MKRIEENEKRLDRLNNIVYNLDKSLEEFENNYKEYRLLNKYYGSKQWFKDKEDFESGKIKNIKAGVLSEDAVWNTLEDIDDLLKRMKKVINTYSKKEK